MANSRDSLANLKSLLEQTGQAVWKTDELKSFVSANFEKWAAGSAKEEVNAIVKLVQERSLELVQVEQARKKIDRYVLSIARPEEIVLSMRPNSYLSHYSAMQLLGLTNNIPKVIYSNLEQFKPRESEKPELKQLTVDKAFARPMRQSNNTVKFEFIETKYQASLLSGYKIEKLGVIEITAWGRKLPTTDIERTMIDATVRPSYCGGVEQVLELFRIAKGECSPKRLLSYYKKMNLIYPYHQAIGFYLERTGFSEKDCKLFDQSKPTIDFYLDYEMRKKGYSEKWRLYYPAELD